jgi:flagellar motor switch/type III secretory pathway protein FliN
MQQNQPLNTFPIQQFIQQVKSAESSQAKELKLSITQAKDLAFTLGIVMARLNGNLEELLQKPKEEVIKISMDGGSSW